MKPIVVSVTGAAGNIGYALLPRILNGDVFGRDRPVVFLVEPPHDVRRNRAVTRDGAKFFICWSSRRRGRAHRPSSSNAASNVWTVSRSLAATLLLAR